MKRVKLRTKFLFLFTIISLIPLVLTLTLTYTRFQRTLEQDAIKLENQLAATASNKIKTFIISQVGILNTIATLYDQEFSAPKDSSKKIVENILYRSENFTDISIVDKNGREVIRQNRVLVFTEKDLGNVGETKAFEIVKEKGLYIGPMYIKEGKPSFDLGRWVVDSQGNFSGAVFAQVNAKIMPEVMANISKITGNGGRVFMVNEKGLIVAHPDLSYILGEKDLASLPVVKNIVKKNPNIEISEKYYNENNEAVLGSAYPIVLESSDIKLPLPFIINWFVVVEQRQDVVFAEAYQVALFFIFISLMVLALIITASLYSARKISAPVEELLRATLEFGKGNLTYRTKIRNDDEIGDLAKNFDQMADEVTQSIEEIKREEKMKSEFVTIAAHQLRTPLTGLKWSLDYLSSGESGQMNPEQKQMVIKTASATNHMIDLVNDLLNLSQIEEGRFGIVLKKQSIIPILEKIKDVLKNLMEEKNVTLNIAADPVLPDVNIDSEKIEIALENIIDNSIKYSLPNGIVDLKVASKEHEIVISVKDTGIGILTSELERIFTKFFRSERALLQHTDGTGLGLYVSKNIIEQHGGKIWFESKENHGTTFYVSLPLST